jgi:hypothetical protein
MITWMAYVIVVSLLLSGAAFAAERAARLYRRSSRWIWALAIVMALLIPMLIASVSIQIPELTTPAVSRKIIALREVTSARLSPLTWMGGATAAAATSHLTDALLRRAWNATSGAMLLGLMFSGVQLSWRRRRWETATLDGRSVHVAQDAGPAVVGLLRPRIVVPAWLLQAPPAQQRVVIAHEQAHLDAQDPQLLTLALCLLVLMPWNLPLWWQLRRLRHAIEVDCDRRVLAAGHDVQSYGETLLAVGARQSGAIGAVAAMSESRSFLEQRIQLMVKQPAGWWRATAATLGFLSLTLVAVAAEVTPPNASDGNGSTHQEIALDATTLDNYVGTYQYRAASVMTITREGAALFAQLTGQPRFPIYAQSPSEFFFKVVDARISFVSDPPGSVRSLILHQSGQDITMPRIDASTANQYAVDLAARIQSQTATPGSEAALRRTIDGILAGEPNYSEMTPELAAVTRQQLPKLEALVQGFGPVQSIAFRGVGQAGWDSYEVKQQGGSTLWRISLDSNGTIDGALVTLTP